MSEKLQAVIDLVKTRPHISEEEKLVIIDALTAQNRELEIEASLERVRSQTMAMQKSDELFEVIKTIYDEFQKLGFHAMNADLMIFTEDKKGYDIWVSGAYGAEGPYRIPEPFYHHPHHQGTMSAWLKGDKLRVTELQGDQFTSFFKLVLDDAFGLQTLSKESKDKIFSLGRIIQTEVFTKHGCIRVGSMEKRTEAQLDIQKRFAKVFDQSYTRFLDLKKAEAQAREAQIELGLERVRARAMSMQNSDELAELVDTVFKELSKLDFSLTRCIIWIFDADTSGATVWSANSEIDKTPHSYYIKFLDHPWHQTMTSEWKARNPKSVYELKGDEKTSIDNRMLNETELRQLREEVKAGMIESERVFLNSSFGNFGSLQVDTLEPLSDANRDIIYRFAKVFDLTYTRFNDLKQAEAQATEAKIEAALEKVRSRSLAMHKSDELKEVVTVVFEKLAELDLVFDGGAVIVIFTEGSKDLTYWIASDLLSTSSSFRFPYVDHPMVTMYDDAREQGMDFFAKVYSFEDKNNYYTYAFEHSDFKYLADDLKNHILESKSIGVSFALSKHSAILTPSFAGQLISERRSEVLKRFAKVFEQAYTRFLDLQKAEAQAREARIEAALEKVRSRSLAMHYSDELREVVAVVLHKLVELGIQMDKRSAVILVFEEGSKDYIQWVASPGHASSVSQITPYFDHPIQADLWNARESVSNFFTKTYSPEEKNSLFQYFFEHTDLQFLLEDEKNWILESENYELAVAFEKNSAVAIASFSGKSLAPNENEILKRFAKVFEQAYTRFLDLQKAEAQAREAKIEAALEKVRAGAMAMHQSQELGTVASLMFDQIRMLGGELWACGVVLCDKNKPDTIQWISSPGIGMLPPNNVPHDLEVCQRNMFEAWKKGEDLFMEEIGGNEIKEHYEALMTVPSLNASLKNIMEAGISLPTWQKNHVAVFKHGYLLIITIQPFEEVSLFPRFAKVFEQAYIRFLDLQKAEAQAREAQIEAALERVRGRAMAMHKSDELLEAGELLYRELARLGIESMTSGYVIMDDEEKIGWIYAASPADGTILPEPTGLPHTNSVMASIKESWKKQEPFHIVELDEQATIDHHTYLAKNSINFLFTLEEFLAMSPEGLVLHSFNFKHGYILVVSKERLTSEQGEMVLRFTKVFQMTYLRFLDLKQAEAQVREARIQLALERVRARTMAMHHSDELLYVIRELTGQFRRLEFNIDTANFNTNPQNKDWDLWIDSASNINPTQVHIPYFDHPIFNKIISALDKGVDFFAGKLNREEKDSFLKHLFENTIFKNASEESKQATLNKKGFSYSVVFSTHTSVTIGNYQAVPYTKEENAILRRFGNVFEQTYSRFLDLQKAEAQAREAQIQLALERVRARTMAMQKSSELTDVAAILFKQVNELGIKVWTTGFNVWSDDNNFYEDYITNPQGSFIEPYTIDTTKFSAFTNISEAKKKGEEFFVQHEEGEMLKETYRHLSNFANKNQFGKILQSGNQFPSQQFDHFVFGSKVSLMFITYEPMPEAHDIFKRFGKVFDQTYTRFLDLQKAEAQAREARIEAALEKIRSRSLGMHQSGEIKDVVSILFEKLKELDLVFDGGAAIHLFAEGSRNAIIWVASPDLAEPSCVHLPYDENAFENNPIIMDIWKAKEAGEHIYNKFYSFKEKNTYFDYVFKHNDFITIPKTSREFILQADSYTASFIAEKNCLLGANSWTRQLFSDNDVEVLKRIARVFEQAYIRFLDLQKAEAQAREAQIEAALERVRARAMSMQKSHELIELINALQKELSR
ncbi:MAG: hypothetical protein JWQ09_2717, partial [Segetibacter sp.]|nr:hypothetical protein [Segetibacter sp.]